jgi:hypothetical protein
MSGKTAVKSMVGGGTFFSVANTAIGAANSVAGFTAANGIGIETMSAAEIIRVSAMGDAALGFMLGLMLGTGTFVFGDNSVLSRETLQFVNDNKIKCALLLLVVQFFGGLTGVAMHQAIHDGHEVDLGQVLETRTFGSFFMLAVMGSIVGSINFARRHMPQVQHAAQSEDSERSDDMVELDSADSEHDESLPYIVQ